MTLESRKTERHVESGLHEAPTTRLLTQEYLFARIAVRDPYFGVRAVTRRGPGEIVADVPIEHDADPDASSVSTGEALRHLGVLGACAAATVGSGPGRHHYVIRAARVDIASLPDADARPALLRGRAKASFPSPTRARAHASLSELASDEPLLEADLQYEVTSAAAFAKALGHTRVDMRTLERSALPTGRDVVRLRSSPPPRLSPLRRLWADGRYAQALLPVPAETCRGHFPLHPVIPVSVVADALCRLAAALVAGGEPHARPVTRSFSLRAEGLVLAGQTLQLTAQKIGSAGRDHTVVCVAVAHGVPFVEMEIVSSSA